MYDRKKMLSDILPYKKQKIVGLCGETAAGKTTIAEYISNKYGYKTVRYSQILSKISPGGISKTELQQLGQKIAQNTFEQRALSHEIIISMNPLQNYVVDGLRQIEDYEELSEYFHNAFTLIYVKSEQSERFERYKKREGMNIGWQEFLAIDDHPCEKNIAFVAQYANRVIENSQGFRHLFSQIDNILTIV